MKLYFNILVLLILSIYVKSDIPVHCLKSQVVGRWKFMLTTPVKKTLSDQYKLTCGHKNPSHEKSALIFNMNKDDFITNIEMELKDSDEVTLVEGSNTLIGKWTMVYDEGFDIVFNQSNSLKNDRSYFIFSKYGKNESPSNKLKSKWVSYCYSTLIGWYYLGDQWGCMYGYKLGIDKDEITNGEAENKLNVVEGDVSNKDKSEATFTTQRYYMDESSSKSGQVEADIIESKSSTIPKTNLKVVSTFLETKFQSDLTDKYELLLASTLKYNEKLVKTINSEDLLWKAENYKEFSHMSFKELNKFAGRHKKIKSKKFVSRDRKNVETGAFIIKNRYKKKQNQIDIKDIPENFNWKEKMSKPRSQGSCGSCYAASTISMLEARLRKEYEQLINDNFPNKDDFSISLDHVLKCSYYNQGCDGGYSYLVSKFYNEFEMILDNCYDKYVDGCSRNCKNPDLDKITLKVANNRYVGGSYGKCSEEKILREVYDNGPIVISLEPDYSFMFYKGGIYMSPNNNWFTNNMPKPEWEKVDHSMVLVGWGVETKNGKNIKYWIIQNSWGSNWGENGFMRFFRGIDHLGIESICETADPILTVGN